MKTLHLNLKRKWFDMILSGEKDEEYREITPYWKKRFFDENCQLKHRTIIFSNGYTKDRDWFKIELDRIMVDYGRIIWGNDGTKECFVLELGAILKKHIK